MSGRSAVGLAVLALLGASCGDGGKGPEHRLVLGAVLPLSGADAGAGTEILSGLELSARASSQGPRVQLRVLDGEGTPVASARRFRELSADPEVGAIVGGWFASTARTLAAVADPSDVPFLALSPLAVPSGGEGGAGTFVLHGIEALGEAAGRFAREDLLAGRAGVLWIPGSEVSGILAGAFRRDFTGRGGKVVWSISPDREGNLAFPPGPQESADVVYVAGPSPWAVKCSELGEKTRTASILTASGWDPTGLEELAGRDVPVYIASFFSETDPSPPTRDLLEECARTGRQATPALALGWDAVRVVREAAAGGASRERIRSALRRMPVLDGATGWISSRSDSRRGEAPAISSVSAGGVVFLKRVEVPPPGEGGGA